MARAGGGIVSTVRATRAASQSELEESALARLDRMLAEGDHAEGEVGLRPHRRGRAEDAARPRGEQRPVGVVTSLLAAHAVPPEYAGRADAYLDEVCIPALHAAHAEGLADAVDGFCEASTFSPEQIGRVFDAARALYADQLPANSSSPANLGGAAHRGQIRGAVGRPSRNLDEEGIAAMAAASFPSLSSCLLPSTRFANETAADRPSATARGADGGSHRP